jgi:hypothetical protein
VADIKKILEHLSACTDCIVLSFGTPAKDCYGARYLGVLFTGTLYLCALSLATHNKTGIGRPETEGFRKHADKHFFWHTQQFYFDDRVTPHIGHGNHAVSTPNDTRYPGMAFTLPPVVRLTY